MDESHGTSVRSSAAPRGRAMRGRERLRVIMDSNFLLLPARFGIDIFGAMEDLLCRRVELALPSPVFDELVRVVERLRGPERIALELAKRCRVLPVELLPGESTDDLIARLAGEWRCPVATNDARLRKRLRTLGLPVIYFRGLGRLEVEGHI